jgi:hypothetical protein
MEGENSLLIKNEDEKSIKALFAAIDFNDENHSYLLNQQIAVSAKAKSEEDVTISVVLEAYKDGKLTSNFHSKVDIFNDIWSQITVPINVTNADSLQIFVEYEGVNKVWIDSLLIDTIK